MKKRIAVTGEGPTDYGQMGFHPGTGQPEWKWGPVKEFCILCLDEEKMDIETLKKDARSVFERSLRISDDCINQGFDCRSEEIRI